MTNDYELLPHDELENLRREVEKIKKNPYPDSKENDNLLDSMNALTTSVNKLIKIFEGAQDELIKEYSEASPTKLLQQISEQNAKIAEGIVALAKIVKKSESSSVLGSSSSDENLTPPSFNDDEIDLNSKDHEVKKDHRKGLIDSFDEK